MEEMEGKLGEMVWFRCGGSDGRVHAACLQVRGRKPGATSEAGSMSDTVYLS